MRLPPEPMVVALPPGAFRRWLRSDMRMMRWVFLALYLAIVATCIVTVFKSADPVPIMFLVIMIAAQAIFILGAGSISLCRPIRRRRLLMPVIVAGLMVVVLVIGLCMAMSELLNIDIVGTRLVIFWFAIGLSWIGWGALFFFHVRDLPRFRAISRLANFLLAGSLAELLATVPAHLIVIRRPGCLVGIATMLGIIAGVSVMLFAFGPMIIVAVLRCRLRGRTACPFAGGDDLRFYRDVAPNVDYKSPSCPLRGRLRQSAPTLHRIQLPLIPPFLDVIIRRLELIAGFFQFRV